MPLNNSTMSLATWWLWRYHAFVDGCRSTLQGVAESCRTCRQSYVYGGVRSARLKSVLFLGKSSEPPEPLLIGSLRRKILLTCPGAFSGTAGSGSNDEVGTLLLYQQMLASGISRMSPALKDVEPCVMSADFSGGGSRVLDAFRSWNWLRSRRKMSEQPRWRREDDEGDWRYSAEWWGTQGGGWGRNEGDIVFEISTSKDNGVVSVTAHPASAPKTSEGQVFSANNGVFSGNNSNSNVDLSYEVLGYEWRVLRFNSITRQSVAKVMVLGHAEDAGKVILLQQPNCIAFEYVKSLISSGLAAVSLAGLDLRHVATGPQKMRILCIGLGGGSLPLFLAHILRGRNFGHMKTVKLHTEHHQQGATVDAVEIDPVVISAAVNTMGFPPCPVVSKVGVAALSTPAPDGAKREVNLWGNLLQRISIYENDGEDFVWEASQKGKGQYDLVFVDAYDGENVVPFKLWDRSGNFLSSLGTILNADHGTVVVNLHTDSAPPSIVERLSGKFGPGYDPALPQGKRVLETAAAYRDVLLLGSDSWRFHGDSLEARTSFTPGLAFTVSVSLQGNISLVVSRGEPKALKETLDLIDENRNLEEYFVDALVQEAQNLQTFLKLPFDMTKRVSRGFRSL